MLRVKNVSHRIIFIVCLLKMKSEKSVLYKNLYRKKSVFWWILPRKQYRIEGRICGCV